MQSVRDKLHNTSLFLFVCLFGLVTSINWKTRQLNREQIEIWRHGSWSTYPIKSVTVNQSVFQCDSQTMKDHWTAGKYSPAWSNWNLIFTSITNDYLLHLSSRFEIGVDFTRRPHATIIAAISILSTFPFISWRWARSVWPGRCSLSTISIHDVVFNLIWPNRCDAVVVSWSW